MRAWLTAALCAAACDPIVHHSRHTPDAAYQFPDGQGGTDPDSAMLDTMPSMTPTLFLDQFDTKYCSVAFTCKNSYSSAGTGQTFAEEFGQNPTECHAIMISYDMAMQVEQYVSQGTITWNAASAETCIASFGYSTCNNFWNNGPTYTGSSCPNALVGSVPDGGNCLTSWQCQNWSSYCDANMHKCKPI